MTDVLKTLFEESGSSGEYLARYFDRLFDLVRGLEIAKLTALVEAVERAYEEDKVVYLIGNGGSAAVAGHWVNDLGPGTHVEGEKGCRVFSLTDALSSLTAVANDEGYENIFTGQLKQKLRPGDLVIAFSVSGNSENIVRGIEYAREHGAHTVGITGISGGRLSEVCHLSIHAPTTADEYGPVEDIYSIIGHAVTGYIAMKRGRKLAH